MPRPKSAAADYERFPARLPKEVLQALRTLAAQSGAPINTELIKLLRRALGSSLKKDEAPMPRQSHNAPTRARRPAVPHG